MRQGVWTAALTAKDEFHQVAVSYIGMEPWIWVVEAIRSLVRSERKGYTRQVHVEMDTGDGLAQTPDMYID